MAARTAPAIPASVHRAPERNAARGPRRLSARLRRQNARRAASASSPLDFPTISAMRTASGEPMTNEPKATHTPGPWHFYIHEPTSVIEVGVPARPVGRKVVATLEIGFDEPFESQQRANARLIASAPDLLALAKRYARRCGMCGGTGRRTALGPDGSETHTVDCAACADIRAVIEKAEGRE